MIFIHVLHILFNYILPPIIYFEHQHNTILNMYYDDAIDIDMFSTHLYHLYTQLLKYNTKREDKIKLQIRRTSDLSEIKYRIKKAYFQTN